MKNVEEFIAQLVKIEFIEDSNCYGHYPFQMYVEMGDGSLEMNALALGGDVLACYRRMSEYINKNAKRIYLSLDFPAGGDIENDFVCIYAYEDGAFSLLAIPYSLEDGKVLAQITQSSQLAKIKEQLMEHIS